MLFYGNLFVLTYFISSGVQSDNEFEKNIKFYVWNDRGQSFISDWQNNQTLLSVCGSDSKFTIIVHGWREDMSAPWVNGTIKNFLIYRGGCVIFMDYS